MNFKGKFVVIVIGCVLLAGCGGGRYVDPSEVDEVGSSFQVTDQHQIADKMVECLTEDIPFPSNSVIRVDEVKNKTSEHIDTKDLTNLIVSKLQKKLRYKHLRFVTDYSDLDASDRAAAIEVNRRISDKDRQRYLRDQTAPDYRIFGELTGIRSITGDKKDITYQFNLVGARFGK